MYQGYRNKIRSRTTVSNANRGGGISERSIESANLDQDGRVVKIFTRIYDEKHVPKTSLLTLVHQPGHEPRAFVQRTKTSGLGWPEKFRPTGDFTPLDPNEALSLVFRSEYNYLDYAGKSAVRQVIDFFPVDLNPVIT